MLKIISFFLSEGVQKSLQIRIIVLMIYATSTVFMIQRYNNVLFRYVLYKDTKGLKKLYKANTEDITLFQLDNFEKSGRENTRK